MRTHAHNSKAKTAHTVLSFADGGVTKFNKLSFSTSLHLWIKWIFSWKHTHQSSLLTDDSDCYGWNVNWEQTHITENIRSRPQCLFSPPRKLIEHHQITTAGEGQLKGKTVHRHVSKPYERQAKGVIQVNRGIILRAVNHLSQIKRKIHPCELNMLWLWQIICAHAV